MSRIDEALKRASVGVAEPRLEEAAPQPAASLAEEAQLDQYPREGRIGAADTIAAFVREEPPPPPDRSAAIVPHRPAPVRHMPTKPLQARPVTPTFDAKLVVGGDVSPMLVEQYRRLAASMHELQLERGLKTLTVTSAVPREGKSLTVANLALTLSESYGRRVLLIDADLRRPSLHDLFGVPNATGLADVLRSERSELPLVRATAHLSLLTSGESDASPVGGIASDRMRTLIAEAATEFDWVLLDAPPVAVMPDAALLAGLTRALILVIAAGSTPYAQVSRAIDELGRDGIVGTVLNRIEERNIPETTFYRDYHGNSSSR